MRTHHLLVTLLSGLSALAMGCQGPQGPAGTPGATGPTGTATITADAGAPAACSAGCSTTGLAVTLTVSAPANGSFFVAGERPDLLIRLTNGSEQVLAPAALGTAELFVAGPRETLSTQTAVKLLNCITDRTVTDRQHHLIALADPHYADPTQANLTTDPDGTMHYTLSAISDEAPGTYTAGVLVESEDQIDQIFQVADLQIGTATAESFVSGAPESATCRSCHTGPANGKTYMAHILPGHTTFGEYALDSAPIADCKLCHNNDGYSLNPIVRKVHGAHRGEHLLDPGIAHPEYGLGADTTLASFTNVLYPALPNNEKDCASCHADDRWKTTPSRLACGTCHDNVFFDTGTLSPPRVLGIPAAGACKSDPDCVSTGNLATCNTTTGICERAMHPVENDDASCATCHVADVPGVAPIAAVHEVYQQTRTRGLTLTGLTLAGSSEPNGVFAVGDTIALRFSLTDRDGNAISDVASNTALAASVLVAGPTDSPQRVIGNPVNMKTTGTLTFDSGSGTYGYLFATTIPVGALAPLNADPSTARPTNPPGTYGVWVYVNETLTIAGEEVRDAGNMITYFALGAAQPLQPRQVISQTACNTCHVVTQAHGGTRQLADGCFMCHNAGALDLGAGSKGLPCTSNAQCPGNAAGWEACQDTNADGVLDTCVAVTDPTPNVSIDFTKMIHKLHFARLLEGYDEAENVGPGQLKYLGYQNGLTNFSKVLFPMDVRNCVKCHTDAAGTCSATAPCGAGQSCVGGTCTNTSWLQPTARVCLACHDAADTNAHAALMTYTDPTTGVASETCSVCHGPGATFAVDVVHDIAHPYVPPYSRTKD